MKVSHATVVTLETERQDQSPSHTEQSDAYLYSSEQFPEHSKRELIRTAHPGQSQLISGTCPSERSTRERTRTARAGQGQLICYTSPTGHIMKCQFVKPGFIDTRYNELKKLDAVALIADGRGVDWYERENTAIEADMKESGIAVDKASSLMGWILQLGVILSACLIILGGLLHLPEMLQQIGIVLQAQAIVTVGLLVLIAIPVVRTAVSILTFALERDYKYVIITSLVLGILLYSIFVLGGTTKSQPSGAAHNLHLSLLTILLIFAGSLAAGILGALIGLGGGVLLVPLLTLIFKIPLELAIGASIISVIATSSGAAAAYVRNRMTNMRVGMFLQLGTTLGAISGALLAGLLAPNILAIIFGIILLISVAPMAFKLGEELPEGRKNDRWATYFNLANSYPDKRLGREVHYEVTRTPAGLAMMYVAGVISGLLGIGSGTFKVLALDTLMRLPLKVSTTTSNLMIGVTAAASAGIYFARGDILPLLAAPVALGVLSGAFIGARLLVYMSNRSLRIIFLPVMVATAVEMVLHGLGIGAF